MVAARHYARATTGEHQAAGRTPITHGRTHLHGRRKWDRQLRLCRRRRRCCSPGILHKRAARLVVTRDVAHLAGSLKLVANVLQSVYSPGGGVERMSVDWTAAVPCCDKQEQEQRRRLACGGGALVRPTFVRVLSLRLSTTST